MVKDLRRSIDYLETRTDIDQREARLLRDELGRVARRHHPGGGGALRRQRARGGGAGGTPARPEASTLNYVTRITMPTLMLNGKYDNGIDTRIKPMFDLLGTPAEHKRLILYETDHIPP